MGCIGLRLANLNPMERGIWQGQNALRRTQEFIEWQTRALWELLQGQNLGLDNEPTWLSPLLAWFTRIVIVLFVAYVLYWLVFWGRRWWRSWQDRRRSQGPDRRQQVLETPLAVQDWLKQAQQAQAQQNYAAACRALYMALLVRFDEADWLGRNLAWTDQEYLRRLEALWVMAARPVDMSSAWQRLFLTHEQSVYGKIPVSAERFHQCQQAYDDLEPELDKGPLLPPER